MRKAFAILALASLLFAGAGLVGCASTTSNRASCGFCHKTGMECKDCKSGEPCGHCRECMQCPDCTPDKACTNCVEYMKTNLAK